MKQNFFLVNSLNASIISSYNFQIYLENFRKGHIQVWEIDVIIDIATFEYIPSVSLFNLKYLIFW